MTTIKTVVGLAALLMMGACAVEESGTTDEATGTDAAGTDAAGTDAAGTEAANGEAEAMEPGDIITGDAATGETVTAQGLPEGSEALGQAITVTEPPVALATVRANPEQYFEKTLLVKATASEVCQNAGCWMTIADVSGEGEPIWVRWSTGCGGQYAFPKDAAGRQLLVQGSFYAKEIAPEDAEHLAGESEGLTADEIVGRTFEMNATACVLLPVMES